MGIFLSILSHIMYISEKFTMCLAAVSVLSCLMLTIVMMLGLGVGLGYNYCYVEMRSKHRYVPGYYRYNVYPATTMGRTPPWRRIKTTTPRRTTPRRTTTTKRTTRRTTRRTTTKSRRTTTPMEAALLYQSPNRKQLIDYEPPSLDDVAELNSTEDDPIIEAVSDEVGSESENTANSTVTKTVIRIQGLDLIALLAKLKAENINYTLQIVTT